VMFFQKLFLKRRGSQPSNENADLIQAMHDLALRDDAESRVRMYEQLLNSTLLIPTPEFPEASPAERNQGGLVSLQLTLITDNQNRKLTPAFTDIEALRNWDPNTACLSARARGFFETVSTYFPDIQGVVVNPFDPIRKKIRPMGTISKGEFEVLARGLVPRPGEMGLVNWQLPTIGIASILEPPTRALPDSVAEMMKGSAKNIPEIARLLVFSITLSHGSPQLTIGIGLDTNVRKEREQFIVQALWSAIAPSLTGHDTLGSLDFVVMDRQIAARAEQVGGKVYERS